MRRALRTCLAAALCLALAACLAPRPDPQLYLLAPAVAVPAPAAARADATPPLAILIKDVRVPLYLDRSDIVTRDADNRLVFADAAHWGNPLRDELARVLAMNLARLLPGDRVATAPYPARGAPDLRLEVDIRSFERQADGRVQLSAQWWITRGRDGALLATGERTLHGGPRAAAGTGALIDAMSDLYGELARAIAASLRRHPAGGA